MRTKLVSRPSWKQSETHFHHWLTKVDLVLEYEANCWKRMSQRDPMLCLMAYVGEATLSAVLPVPRLPPILPTQISACRGNSNNVVAQGWPPWSPDNGVAARLWSSAGACFTVLSRTGFYITLEMRAHVFWYGPRFKVMSKKAVYSRLVPYEPGLVIPVPFAGLCF